MHIKGLLLLFVPCILLGQPPRGQRPMGPPPPMVYGHPVPPVGMGRPVRRMYPHRLEMTPLPLTDKQQKELTKLRKEYIQKRNRILNNP